MLTLRLFGLVLMLEVVVIGFIVFNHLLSSILAPHSQISLAAVFWP